MGDTFILAQRPEQRPSTGRISADAGLGKSGTGKIRTARSFARTTPTMDKSIRVFKSHQEMKAEEYRYWQSRPAHERMNAVTELTISAYRMKEPARDVQRLQRTVVLLQRPQR